MLRLFLICTVLFSNQLHAQFFKNKERLSNARYFTSLKNFEESECYYEKLITNKPKNCQILLEYSEVLIHQNKLLKADSLLHKIIDQPCHNKHLTKAYMLSGIIQKRLSNYENAKTYFNKSIEVNNSNNIFLQRKSKRELESIDWAMKHQMDSADLKVLGHSISSYNATLHSVSDSFIVASVYDYSNIYKINAVSIKESNQVILPKIDNDIILNNGSFSDDKKYFYFSKCSKNLKCVLMVGTLIENKINSIDTLKSDFFDLDFTFTMPYVGNLNGKKVLFFCSNKVHGKGGLDIYYGELKSPYYLKNIKSIPAINSSEDDISPIFNSKENRLYFCSSWFDNFGGKDVFYSQVNGNLFSKPENMGKPINSSSDEISYAKMDSIHFVTSNRNTSLNDGNCCSKIFAFKKDNSKEQNTLDTLKSVAKYTKDDQLQKIKSKLPLSLYFHNDIPNPKSIDTTTSYTYLETYLEYINLLPLYKHKFSHGLSEEQKLIAENEMTQFFETKVKKGYDDLIELLDLLENELKNGAHIELQIKGFASPLAKSNYNNHLSKRRIASFKNLLFQYNNGALKQFLDTNSQQTATLTFKEVPFGEEKSEKHVSDNPNDKKSSIFSIKAALERKIEILDALEIKD